MKTERAGPLEALLNSTLRKVWRRLKAFVSPRSENARRPSDDYESFASDLLEQMNRFFAFETGTRQKVWLTVCTKFVTILLVIFISRVKSIPTLQYRGT